MLESEAEGGIGALERDYHSQFLSKLVPETNVEHVHVDIVHHSMAGAWRWKSWSSLDGLHVWNELEPKPLELELPSFPRKFWC
jgi:hypothetical protein